MDSGSKKREIKIELEKQLTFYEKERNRSMKWFFINLFSMIINAGLALWLVTELIGLIAKAFVKLDDNSLTLEKMLNSRDEKVFKMGLRLSHLNHLNSFLIFVVFGVGLFWVLFRFRKWTKYNHRIKLLRRELDELEGAKVIKLLEKGKRNSFLFLALKFLQIKKIS